MIIANCVTIRLICRNYDFIWTIVNVYECVCVVQFICFDCRLFRSVLCMTWTSARNSNCRPLIALQAVLLLARLLTDWLHNKIINVIADQGNCVYIISKKKTLRKFTFACCLTSLLLLWVLPIALHFHCPCFDSCIALHFDSLIE